ncbi:MAG: threonylcarbamoyl-AMP synthase, partial [Planctomycetota bacterium]
MQTEVLHLSTDNFEPVQLKKAVELLKKDEPIIFPTETVYGLGVPYHSSKALERLNQLKKRDPKKPYTLHIAEKRDVYTFIPSLPPHIERVMDFFWPGPLTIILANGKGEKYGFRLPAHKVAQELIRQVGVPLCASSANPEGYSPPTTCEEALKFFMDKVHLAIDSGPSVLRQASTVVDFSYPKFRVLREGIISAKMIQKVAGFQILFVCTGNTCRSPMAEALFRHLFAQKLSISPEKLADLGYMVRSAGIFAQPNTPANPLA